MCPGVHDSIKSRLYWEPLIVSVVSSSTYRCIVWYWHRVTRHSALFAAHGHAHSRS